ncbi:hypothetical protein, partial [Burkholderia stagnalis]
MAVRFFLKAISHPKTPSARRRRWGGGSGGYAACATAPPAKTIVVKPDKVIVAVYGYLKLWIFVSSAELRQDIRACIRES